MGGVAAAAWAARSAALVTLVLVLALTVEPEAAGSSDGVEEREDGREEKRSLERKRNMRLSNNLQYRVLQEKREF